MPQPSQLPTFATDSLYSSGADVGLPTKVELTSGEKASGLFRGKRAPARKLNWLIGLICDWIAFVSKPSVANVTLTNDPTSAGGSMPLTVAGDSYPTGEYHPRSGSGTPPTQLVVPNPGLYEVHFAVTLLRDSGSDANCTVEINQVGGVTATAGRAIGPFLLASGSYFARVVGVCLVEIADPTTDWIKFTPSCDVTPQPDGNNIIVRYLGSL